MTSELFAGLPAPLRDALMRRGFESLTPVQQAVVSARSAGRDLRISSQTGSGKTVAIGIALADHFLESESADAADGVQDRAPSQAASREAPAESDAIAPTHAATPHTAASAPSSASAPPRGPRAERGQRRTRNGAARPSALIIVPTRELAAQVSEEIGWLYAGLPEVGVEVVTGGTSVMMERRALARGPGIVVGTPGRLLDHIQNAALTTDAIAHVVLDEADQMLDMGFREELQAILETLPESRSSHLVSATFPRAVLELANDYQRDALVIEGTRLGAANSDIQHIAYAIRRHETYGALVNLLLTLSDERVLVFVNRRVDATELAEKLASDGFGAAPFSGELAQAQRTRTLAAFRNGTLPVLISTDVAARGIDVPGIGAVVHVDLPRDPNAYTHRSGRTGRAGEAGRSLLFVTPPDLAKVERMARHAKIDLSWQPIPTPEKVEKLLRKRARRELHATLAEHTPEEPQWMYAKTLLEGRDPVQVVATLLDLAKPDVVCKPVAVQGFDPAKSRGGRSRDDRGGRDRRPDRGDREDAGRSPRLADDAYTRFFVSWGRESGATTARLLSQICRRGGIDRHQVGAIEVAARVSFVSVSNEVAKAVEARVARPDARDRGIVIKRADDRPGRPGGAGEGPANRRGPHTPNERSGRPPSESSASGGLGPRGARTHRGRSAGPKGRSSAGEGNAPRVRAPRKGSKR